MILKLLRILNQYASLFLVAITTVYVWLTWRSLRALREASLREREAQHLRDIKERVLQPAISWITLTVFGRFTGKTPELLTVSCLRSSGSTVVTHTVDNPFAASVRLDTPGDADIPDELSTWTSTESGRISKLLFEHSKLEHFSDELGDFDRLFDKVRLVTATLITQANEAAQDIAQLGIPQAVRLGDENSIAEWCNPHRFAANCIQSFLAGVMICPTRLEAHGSFHSLLNQHNAGVARSTDAEKLKRWSEAGFEKVRARWKGNSLGQKVMNLLEHADTVRRDVDQLMFTQTLGVNCELVGGKKRRWPGLLRGRKSSPKPHATP